MCTGIVISLNSRLFQCDIIVNIIIDYIFQVKKRYRYKLEIYLNNPSNNNNSCNNNSNNCIITESFFDSLDHRDTFPESNSPYAKKCMASCAIRACEKSCVIKNQESEPAHSSRFPSLFSSDYYYALIVNQKEKCCLWTYWKCLGHQEQCYQDTEPQRQELALKQLISSQ